jgi:hydrogenase-4 component B
MAAMDMPLTDAVWAWTGVAGLAFIGGLSVIGFTRAMGVIFSGEPRTTDAADAKAHDPGPLMRAAMWSLGLLALGAALAAPFLFTAMLPAARLLLSGQSTALPVLPSATIHPEELLTAAAIIAFGAAALALILAFARSRLLAGRSVRSHGTWDCGYIKPAPRMQYTASSYAEPMTVLFRRLLGEKRRFTPPEGLFPATGSARFASETPDRVKDGFFVPLFSAVLTACDALKRFQQGNLNLYILYLLATLVILLAIALGFAS